MSGSVARVGSRDLSRRSPRTNTSVGNDVEVEANSDVSTWRETHSTAGMGHMERYRSDAFGTISSRHIYDKRVKSLLFVPRVF
jgi:hypothetical protein